MNTKPKYLFIILTVLLLSILSGCKITRDTDSAFILLSAENTTLEKGYKDGVSQLPSYSPEYKMVEDIISGASVSYEVPGIEEGKYDIYLEIGKTQSMVGSTIFEIYVNKSGPYVLPTNVIRANSEGTDRYEKGLFLMANDVFLSQGDKIKVIGKSGYTTIFGNNQIYCSIPPIGDIKLYPSGIPVVTGYEPGNAPQKEKLNTEDPLSGKTICWLGSSVTYGAKAEGYSMADTIKENHPETLCLKYTISGTTLTNIDSSSYVARLKNDIPKNLDVDFMIIQLSTNDAKPENQLSLGNISFDKTMEAFDDTTIIGAMETIIAYTQQTWNCPVIFYTNPYYDNTLYAQMVDSLYLLQEKWGIGIIDLWNDKNICSLIGTDTWEIYMADDTHPTKIGYEEWWAPIFDTYLTEYTISSEK